jgi:hypothetical protein
MGLHELYMYAYFKLYVCAYTYIKQRYRKSTIDKKRSEGLQDGAYPEELLNNAANTNIAFLGYMTKLHEKLIESIYAHGLRTKKSMYTRTGRE